MPDLFMEAIHKTLAQGLLMFADVIAIIVILAWLKKTSKK